MFWGIALISSCGSGQAGRRLGWIPGVDFWGGFLGWPALARGRPGSFNATVVPNPGGRL